MHVAHRSVRLIIVAVLAAAVPLLAAISGPAAETEADPQLQLLFIQNSTAGKFDGKRLTLEHVGPTVVFSDRPERFTGHMKTSDFVGQWATGEDNFQEDPPNAGLSIFSNDSLETSVVEISNPKLEGTTLSYDVVVLDGTLPKRFGESSLFIDILGRGRSFMAGAAVGHSSAEKSNSSQQQAAAATPAPAAPSSECQQAQKQLVDATTEDATQMAKEKVDALCPK